MASTVDHSAAWASGVIAAIVVTNSSWRGWPSFQCRVGAPRREPVGVDGVDHVRALGLVDDPPPLGPVDLAGARARGSGPTAPSAAAGRRRGRRCGPCPASAANRSWRRAARRSMLVDPAAGGDAVAEALVDPALAGRRARRAARRDRRCRRAPRPAAGVMIPWRRWVTATDTHVTPPVGQRPRRRASSSAARTSRRRRPRRRASTAMRKRAQVDHRAARGPPPPGSACSRRPGCRRARSPASPRRSPCGSPPRRQSGQPPRRRAGPRYIPGDGRGHVRRRDAHVRRARAPRRSTTSTWRSPTASSSCSSARRAAASRRRCGCWPGSSRSTRARSTSATATSPRVAPKDRDIAMVFQSYALYPHMTVAENIGFHLKVKRVPKARAGPAGAARPPASSTSSRSSTASRPSCRAASASGWRWVGRSCASRRCS